MSAASHSGAANGMSLEVRNVTKFFGDFKAVNDVSFNLAPGSICGFLGPNGAGKTTTIRMVLDIFKPSSGTISILGHSSALEVRHRIGYLPEEKGLYKKMKAWAVIAYFASLKGMSRKAARRRAYELLERYGLKDFAEKPTDALSKGMSQKVQVLACIAHDPELVILDEPFSGLDPVNQQVMEEIIRDLVARERTVLFSTHVMQHAERLCDRILLIAKGSTLFDGSIPHAKALLPRRVRIETADDVEPLRRLSEVVGLRAIEPPAHAGAPGQSSPVTTTAPQFTAWEVSVREDTDPQTVLQACFANRIGLRSFNPSDPTLHDVFVHLVGPEAREAAAR